MSTQVPKHLQEVPNFSHDLDYTPNDVPDDEAYQLLADMGVPPEEVVDPKERAEYIEFLKSIED